MKTSYPGQSGESEGRANRAREDHRNIRALKALEGMFFTKNPRIDFKQVVL